MARQDNTSPPSEEMENAFRCGGGIVIECSCGREHFEDSESGGDWDEGELDRLRARANEHPDKTVACGYCVTYANINGQTYILGCPCNGMRKYEDFLWLHRTSIAAYLSARSITEKAVADLNHALVGDLTDKVFE